MRVHVAQIVRARTGETGHGAGLQRIAFFGFPVLGSCQRRFAFFGRQVFVHFRQQQRQLVVRQGVRHSVLIIDREGFAPVTLAAEDGIAQAEVRPGFAYSSLLDFFHHAVNRLLHFKPVQEIRIDQGAVLGFVGFLADVPAGHDLAYGQVEVLGETVVPAVVRGYGHDGSRPVSCQHVFRNPYRKLFPAERVYRIRTGEHPAGFVDIGLAFAFGAVLGVFHIVFHCFFLFCRGQGRNHFVFRAKDHEADSEKGVRPGREYLQSFVQPFLCSVFNLEADFGPGALANPVALHLLERVGPVQFVQTV